MPWGELIEIQILRPTPDFKVLILSLRSKVLVLRTYVITSELQAILIKMVFHQTDIVGFSVYFHDRNTDQMDF